MKFWSAVSLDLFLTVTQPSPDTCGPSSWKRLVLRSECGEIAPKGYHAFELRNQPFRLEALHRLVSAATAFESGRRRAIACVGEVKSVSGLPAFRANKAGHRIALDPLGLNQVVLLGSARHGHCQLSPMLLDPDMAGLAITNVNRDDATSARYGGHINACNTQDRHPEIIHHLLPKYCRYSEESAERRRRPTSPRKVRGWA